MHLSRPWFSYAWSSYVRLSFSVKYYSTSLISSIVAEDSEASLPSCQVHPKDIEFWTNLAASRVGYCNGLPERFGILWLHRAGHCHAEQLGCTACIFGTATGRIIISLYLTVFKLPSVTKVTFSRAISLLSPKQSHPKPIPLKKRYRL